jgi:homoserine dehydrogenase
MNLVLSKAAARRPSAEESDRLFELARAYGRRVRHETTVGAGQS